MENYLNSLCDLYLEDKVSIDTLVKLTNSILRKAEDVGIILESSTIETDKNKL